MNQYEYMEIEEAILGRQPEIQISYENQLYWILVGKKVFFGDIDGNISLHFSTPEELFNTVLIRGKKLSEIWNEVVVESFEG